MLDTVVISGDDVCCSVVFGTLIGMFVFSVVRVADDICYQLSSVVISVRVPESGVCVHISDKDCVWYVYDILYAVLYFRVSCIVVRAYAISRWYIHVFNRDMFSVINVYLEHLQFCVVCINGQMCVYCSECNVVSNECNKPTLCHVQPISTNGGEVMYFWCVCLGVS